MCFNVNIHMVKQWWPVNWWKLKLHTLANAQRHLHFLFVSNNILVLHCNSFARVSQVELFNGIKLSQHFTCDVVIRIEHFKRWKYDKITPNRYYRYAIPKCGWFGCHSISFFKKALKLVRFYSCRSVTPLKRKDRWLKF